MLDTGFIKRNSNGCEDNAFWRNELECIIFIIVHKTRHNFHNDKNIIDEMRISVYTLVDKYTIIKKDVKYI